MTRTSSKFFYRAVPILLGLLLLARLIGMAAAPLLLMAHLDVVPVEPGTEAKWAHGSFSGDVSGGYVWGRGTLDDKLNVVGQLEAIDGLIRKPPRDPGLAPGVSLPPGPY